MADDKNLDPNKGTPPDSNGGTGTQEIDLTKLSDHQIVKVLEDQRLWNTPRLTELREQAKAYKKLKEDQKLAEEDRLKQQGEYQALAQSKEAEAKKWQEQYNQSIINNRIMQEAAKAGIVRLDLADKLIDRSQIKLDEAGSVLGVTEAVQMLIKDNDFLIGKQGTASLGSGSNPPAGAGDAEFTISQIQNPAFYQVNRDKIMRAQAQGKIIDDRQ